MPRKTHKPAKQARRRKIPKIDIRKALKLVRHPHGAELDWALNEVKRLNLK